MGFRADREDRDGKKEWSSWSMESSLIKSQHRLEVFWEKEGGAVCMGQRKR